MSRPSLSPSIILCFVLASIYSCQSEAQSTSTATVAEKTDPYYTYTQDTYSYFPPKVITRNVLRDRTGLQWLATWHGIVTFDGQRYTNQTLLHGLQKFRAFSIIEDRQGHVWIGTVGAGVYRYDGSSFRHYDVKDGLANDIVLWITEDRNGVIWLGTDNGLSRYDGKTWKNYYEQDGLSGRSINTICEDHLGRLWIGTRYGAKIDLCIMENDKLIPSPFDTYLTNVRSIIVDHEKALWIGAQNGLYQVKDEKIRSISNNFVGYLYRDKEDHIYTAEMITGGMGLMMYYGDMPRLIASHGQVFGIIVEGDTIRYGTEKGYQVQKRPKG
jgi:ligand-binding sensor domain-containing protein